jgi:hypothetical protein
VEAYIDAGNIQNRLVTFHTRDSWRKGYCSFFDMWELLVHVLEDTADILVDEYIKISWLNKTHMTCKEFATILQTIDTTETTMLALQGSSGNKITRLPWSIWLAMLKDEVTKLDKKKESRSNSQRMNHSISINAVAEDADMAEEAEVDDDTDQATQAAIKSQRKLNLGCSSPTR